MTLIKKFSHINMAIYQDFDWDKICVNENNEPLEFKQVNILYGRNYSGKTTLSRIVRAFETGKVSDKYETPSFSLLLDSGNELTQANLDTAYKFRVFNEDFVRENLKFIHNPEESIESFAILGEDVELEAKITKLRTTLGKDDKETPTGLYSDLAISETTYKDRDRQYEEAKKRFEKYLTKKANSEHTGIKHNPLYRVATYNKSRLVKDCDYVIDQELERLSEVTREEKKQTIKEDKKDNITFTEPSLRLDELIIRSQLLVEKDITISEPIQELLTNSLLNEWVREGVHHHKERETCAFCQQTLPNDLWDKLNKHFSQESEKLRSEIEEIIKEINTEKNNTTNGLTLEKNQFYSAFHDHFESMQSDYTRETQVYSEALGLLFDQLEKRKDNISQKLIFESPQSNVNQIKQIYGKFQALCKKSNQYTNDLNDKQKEARDALRLDEVCKYVVDSNYQQIKQNISTLEEGAASAQEAKDKVEKEINDILKQIEKLEAQLGGEAEGAKKINEYLNHFFGHQMLSLQPVLGERSVQKSYQFEVQRNGIRAHHLSEGECRLIAFCYFMAKLHDANTKNEKPIIWIDDPICSLDANHIFFVFSLIKAKIIKEKKYSQLFISTHSLEFLKYLKKLSDDYKGRKPNQVLIRQFFVVERLNNQKSNISIMPSYLKKYITEFNYLFDKIYQCANNSNLNHDHDTVYNFANNARKFLEIYLYYKFPNGEDRDNKLSNFLDEKDSIAENTLNRVNNEYSHLCGLFERGSLPIDIPEMQKVAQKILDKIKEKDSEQYQALCESIGVCE
ncbi:AAA family ATPase [Cysteiniphilum sp. QT6929]|uniref:AAA family ATPase n=1 Tax=Cysteiniphilum sp. QT6929 TaxID=2975055 RepID=UPI0024B37239|nr:AAA family ATPase [Cysteiniphilum sp. QT6929]WHN65391.1 AAA family ATPase [Cysteiniphilum sp. QT6929]